MAVYLSEGSIMKGLLMATLGIVIGTVGIDPVFGYRDLPSVSRV